MDMIVVKALPFNGVGVLMALAIIAPQAEQLVAVQRAECQNDRKVQWVDLALPDNQPVLIPALALNLQLLFAVRPLGPWMQFRAKILGQQLPFFQKRPDLDV
jgi:hypothetical protein